MRLITRKQIIPFFYFLFIFILIKYFVRSILDGYAKESWNITEFLINYEGGFVRRGLCGALLLILNKSVGLNPYYLILAVCCFAYGLLIFLFVKLFMKNGYTLFVLPCIFFIGNPVLNNFWVRKDVLLILFFMAIISAAVQRPTNYVSLFKINILLITGLLIHESLAFFCLPVLFLLLMDKNRNDGTYAYSKAAVLAAIELLPAGITFLLLLYFKGSPAIADQIWASWKPVPFPIQETYSTILPAAIDGVSWSLKQGLSLSYSMLSNFDHTVYAPLGWLVILAAIFMITTNTDKLSNPVLRYTVTRSINQVHMSNILITQFIVILPLFILGWDYGRWIFLWISSSFAILLLVPENTLAQLFPKYISRFSQKILHAIDMVSGKSSHFFILLILLTGFPVCCWDLLQSVKSSACILILQFISTVIKLLFSL